MKSHYFELVSLDTVTHALCVHTTWTSGCQRAFLSGAHGSAHAHVQNNAFAPNPPATHTHTHTYLLWNESTIMHEVMGSTYIHPGGV